MCYTSLLYVGYCQQEAVRNDRFSRKSYMVKGSFPAMDDTSGTSGLIRQSTKVINNWVNTGNPSRKPMQAPMQAPIR